MIIRSFFSRLCHQDPARSFLVDGSPVAVCVRCLGIYCGVALAAWFRVGREFAFRLLAAALLINVLDVASGALHWQGNLPLVRLLFGLLLVREQERFYSSLHPDFGGSPLSAGGAGLQSS